VYFTRSVNGVESHNVILKKFLIDNDCKYRRVTAFGITVCCRRYLLRRTSLCTERNTASPRLTERATGEMR